MYKNTTHALTDVLRRLMMLQDSVSPRGQETKELLSQKVAIQNPVERVYVVAGRHNNIFATIAETMWVIAGRNDLEFLSRYLPRAKAFSDDGLVWRAGYGPRLRNWHDTDQLKNVARILTENPDSRRAVVSLFDPAEDYTDSKDIPCNNWLHFLIRDGELHLNVAIRSNDAIWGFSGINTFEWSVVQEMMAYWTKARVGRMTLFVSSLHIYSRHYARAHSIVDLAQPKSLYDFGFSSAPFAVSIDQIDVMLAKWFEIEDKIRKGKNHVEAEIASVSDSFFRATLEMLHIYNRFLEDASKQELAALIERLPSNDFKLAAIEYLSRRLKDRHFVTLEKSEADYFDYFWDDRPHTQGGSFEQVVELLKVLHYKKTLVYKDSWKKHGEVIGIFANISRKYDRIESIVVNKAQITGDETTLDTFADLAVYSAKYLTYLAEHYAGIFGEFISEYEREPSDLYFGNDGFDPITDILVERYNASGHLSRFESIQEVFHEIKINFDLLDNILIDGDWRKPDIRKCSAAADLAITSIHAILLIAETEPGQLNRFVEFIEFL